jgi:hypothetical protein
LLYTLERGAVASKPAAARWAEHCLGEPWVQLIERALAGTGDAAPISEADVTEIVADTVALVEFTVERFRQWQVK